MGYRANKNDVAVGNGGAGTPHAWDIIGDHGHDLEGNIVCAFMSLDEDGGTFTEMKEETTIGHGGKPGVSEDVPARYLGYTYPQNVVFEGNYTSLVPAAGKLFKVWFLK
ncbi:MAG: hypothetical protein WC554_06360 [Clostridia bacterium]